MPQKQFSGGVKWRGVLSFFTANSAFMTLVGQAKYILVSISRTNHKPMLPPANY